MDKLNSMFVEANGIRFHCVTAGEGPLCLCLHGFPETRYSWRNQVPLLSRAYQVVVPDMRGYGETDAPKEVSQYRLNVLIDDVKGLIDAFGREEALIVSHDWGGVVAIHYAQAYPDTVSKLVVSNAPHLGDYTDLMLRKRNRRQMLKSWYVQMNQIPGLSERLMALGNFFLLERLVKLYAVRKEVFNREVMTEWKTILRLSGLRGGVNYYRATIWAIKAHFAGRLPSGLISCPVKVIWGETDRALERELADGIRDHVSGPFEMHIVRHCGHWVQQEAPEEYNAQLVDFLGI